MTPEEFSQAERAVPWLIVGVIGSTLASRFLFFGGSERDPWWMWLVFYTGFYGGIVAMLGGVFLMFSVEKHRPHS